MSRTRYTCFDVTMILFGLVLSVTIWTIATIMVIQ